MSLARRFAPLLALVLMMVLAGCGGTSTNGGGTSVADSGSGGGDGAALPTPSPIAPGFVVSLAITPNGAVLGRGASVQLQVVATYADATRHNVTRLAQWSSGQGQIVSVSPTGLLTGSAAGTTTVTATYRGFSASIPVQVVSGTLQGLSVTPASASVIAGRTQQYTATATFSQGQAVDVTRLVNWVSSDPRVATVSDGSQSAGLAQGRAPGSVRVSAVYGAFTAAARLDVAAPQVVSVAVTPATATLQPGTTARFTGSATYTDGSRSDVTALAAWTTSNAAVVTVNGGTATAVAAGSAAVRATFQAQSGQADVRVTQAQLVSIAVTPANATLAFGSDRQYAATGTYDDGSTADLTAQVTWASSTPAVATVTGGGLVAAVAAGASTISATLGAISGTTPVTVTAAPLVSIAVSPPAGTSLITGTTRPYTAVGTFADGSTADVTDTVTWTSSSTSVATVSARGVVAARRNGVTDIVASEGAITASVKARVMLYAYATDGGAVYGYAVDPANASLTPVPGPPFTFGSCICALTVDPSNRWLYALDGSMDQIYTFDIRETDGTLALRVGAVATGSIPNSIQATPDGRFLYVTNGEDGTVSGYALGANGSLTAIPGSPFALGRYPTQVAFDPTSRFAYVVDSDNNDITAMAIDPVSGALSRIASYPAGSNALSVAVTPDGRFVYSAGTDDATIHGYSRNPDGTLVAVPGSPWSVGCAPYSLVVEPNSRFLYDLDVSSYAINGWAIDAASGALTPTFGQPYAVSGILPDILALDPAGRFMYTAFLVDTVLEGFGIGPDGALRVLPASPFPVDNPMEYIQLTH